VADASVKTPGGTGVVAFADKAAATTFAGKGGLVQTWSQMLNHWRRGGQP